MRNLSYDTSEGEGTELSRDISSPFVSCLLIVALEVVWPGQHCVFYLKTRHIKKSDVSESDRSMFFCYHRSY